MHTVSRLLVSILCLVPSMAAQPWRMDSAKLSGVGQDSTGQVWAIGYAPSLGLYRWEGDKWSSVVDGLPGNAQPMAIASGSDGAVYCVWSAGEATHSLTRHLGISSKVLARFTGSLATFPSIFGDVHGNVWITEMGPHIYRVTPEGKAECIYTIPDDEYVAFGPTRGPRRMFNPVYATGDALGRIWFWSGGVAIRTNLISLQGLLIYDGESFKTYPHLVGVSYEKVSPSSPMIPDTCGCRWPTINFTGLIPKPSRPRLSLNLSLEPSVTCKGFSMSVERPMSFRSPQRLRFPSPAGKAGLESFGG